MGSKFTDWAKLGLFLYVIRELSRPANNDNNLNNPIPRSLTESNEIYGGRQIPQSSGNKLTMEELRSILRDSVNAAFDNVFKKPTLLEPQITKPSPDPQTIEAGEWLRLIPHPSIVIILGKRGSGKSALGYRLLEFFRWVANLFVVGLPKEARKYLPDWIGMATSLENVPPKSIILVDEAYMPYHARSSMAAEAKAMSQQVNLSRQREQTLIFVSQEARQIDRNIASSASVIIFKDLGILQLEFDRRELNKIATNAQQAFATISRDKKRHAYVYSPDADFMGLVENSLPTFWTPKLSHIFAAGGEITARAPEKTSLSQRIEKAKELNRQGLSNGQIRKIMGVSKATIKNWLEDYPYKK